METPNVIQPRVEQRSTEAKEVKKKKDIVDDETAADIQYGSGKKDDSGLAAKQTGADSLKIGLNTGDTGAGSGGLNV
tara:strand:+ start:346 stop:576 length:231 start_codon:yes stop_codon:yes gene_type:complete